MNAETGLTAETGLIDFAVLEAITPSRIGGAEVFTVNLCRMLPELGADVSLFCPAGRPFVGYAKDAGVKCVSWRTFGKLDPITVFKLCRLIKNSNAQVIHTHLSTASLLGALAARIAGVPSVAHVHGLNTATCFKYSTRVIAVSEAVKEHLCAQGLAEEKVCVVHNGVDTGRFVPKPLDEAKRDAGYDADSPVIGVFGRLSSEKGQRIALESMFVVLKDYPDARMLVVGDGKDRQDLETSAEALGIGDSVEFVGFVKDPRPLMSACDVVVVPSTREGFGLAAVEAMALERPVVASMTGGLKEIVVPGETGFVFAVGASLALAQNVIDLLGDRELADGMGKAGRRRVEECFSLKTQMQRVMDVLRETAG